jgi:hypothetical protein
MDSIGGRIGLDGEGGLSSRARPEEDEGVRGGPLVTLLLSDDFEETIEFLRMGELAEERRERLGANDCSNGLGSRSKFDLALRERESRGSEVAASGGRGCCF